MSDTKIAGDKIFITPEEFKDHENKDDDRFMLLNKAVEVNTSVTMDNNIILKRLVIRVCGQDENKEKAIPRIEGMADQVEQHHKLLSPALFLIEHPKLAVTMLIVFLILVLHVPAYYVLKLYKVL